MAWTDQHESAAALLASFAPPGAHLALALGFVTSGSLAGLLGRFLFGLAFGVRQRADAMIRWSIGSHSAILFSFSASRVGQEPEPIAVLIQGAKTPERNIPPRSGAHGTMTAGVATYRWL